MVDWVRAPTKNPAPTAKRSLVLGLDDGQYQQARRHFAMATNVLEKMILAKQAVENSIAEKQFIESRVNVCNDTELATLELSTVLLEDDAKIPALLSLRIRHFQKLGQTEEVEAVAEKLRNLVPHQIDNLYNAACAYSICSSLAPQATPLTADTTQSRYFALAIGCLNEAVALGFDKCDTIRQDADLTPLVNLPEFVELFPPR